MKKTYLLFTLLAILFLSSCGQSSSVKTDKWLVKYNEEGKSIRIEKNSKHLVEGLYASFKLGDKLITSKDYAKSAYKTNAVSDGFGQGSVFEITYTSDSLPRLVQTFYVYNDKDYILTDIQLEDAVKDVSSNYMAPVNIDRVGHLLPEGDNRALFVPFDNDAWVRFQAYAFTFDKLRSYEVTTIYNNQTRNGLVIGSVEHDNWKTAVDMTKGDLNNIGSLVCYGGVADSLTRDTNVHGSLTGKKIKSPKVMIGFFDDWRTGMDEYGKVNAIIAPCKEWNKAVPFGWNSWGALQFNMRPNHVMEVSDYFKDKLQNNHFVSPDNLVYIGLDSGWNIFSEDELKDFVQKCKANGQIAGIYWTPFTDWGKNPEKDVEDAPGYKFKDIYIYAQGKPQEFDGAYAIDPTHPAIAQRMKVTSDLFRRCGFEYVKMDFMGHGAMEGDKWYRPEIRTGIQAYNYGMVLLNKYFGDMFLNLSISPVFPAQYAQSRRIACDAWNKIKDTEYTMNAVSYGWWIDNVYQFNDADHVVLRDATEGENRARITSAVITGLFIAGDDFSKTGDKGVKARAEKYLTNAAVNAVAVGKSFRPVEGVGEKSENQFVYTDKKGITYLAVFNYTDNDNNSAIPYERIGLDVNQVLKVTELWSGLQLDKKAQLAIPSKDVKLLKIEK